MTNQNGPRCFRDLGIFFALGLLASMNNGCTSQETYQIASGPRDFVLHPAVERIDPQPSRIFAISDVHGGYQRMMALFLRHGLIASLPSSPKDARWNGGDAVLLVLGDLIDKGDCGIEVIDALMALESTASASGGRVIVLVGNHEAEFFVDPENSKASAFDDELAAAGLTPLEIASGKDPRGAWLRTRPFAARVGRWFFAHAGNTKGRGIDEIENALERALKANDYADPEFTGPDSLLEARNWFASTSMTGAEYANALGAEHIVFGHDPNALGPSGAIATGQAGALVRIDCGMSPAVNDSEGALLRITTQGTVDHADSLQADGIILSLF